MNSFNSLYTGIYSVYEVTCIIYIAQTDVRSCALCNTLNPIQTNKQTIRGQKKAIPKKITSV